MNAKIIRTVIAAAALVAGFGSVAQAQTAETRFHTSELSSAVGQRVVLTRIERAARAACIPGGWSLGEKRVAKECAAQLTEQLVAKAKSPALTALLNGTNSTELAANAR